MSVYMYPNNLCYDAMGNVVNCGCGTDVYGRPVMCPPPPPGVYFGWWDRIFPNWRGWGSDWRRGWGRNWGMRGQTMRPMRPMGPAPMGHGMGMGMGSGHSMGMGHGRRGGKSKRRRTRYNHTAKWERCVQKVKHSGRPVNPFAICTKTVGW
jgi:hypothetical protein